jgi:hypothetical protein
LNLVAGNNIELLTNNSTKSITINSTGGGVFEPTITSPSLSDFLIYNSYSSQWENNLVPIKTLPLISINVNVLNVEIPTYVFSNVNTLQYEAQLSTDSNFSTIVHSFAPQSGRTFDCDPFVIVGITYYFRVRSITDFQARTSQWINTSFVAQDPWFNITAVRAWAHGSMVSADPLFNQYDIQDNGNNSTAVFPPNSGNTAVWYFNQTGRMWSLLQRGQVAMGRAEFLGTQAISGNDNYTFRSDEILATVNGGGSPRNSWLLFDMGQNRTVSRSQTRAQFTSSPGAFSGILGSYYGNNVIQYWDGGAWLNLYTTPNPTTITSGLVTTFTFTPRTFRFYRLSAGGNGGVFYALCSQCSMG